MANGDKGSKWGDNTLNILNQQLLNVSRENQFVTFTVGEEEYGIDILLVQEIIRYHKPTRVFNTNPVINGVINFRGKVIPQIDLRKKFNLPEVEYDNFTVVIVVEVENKTMGLIVDRVSDIVSFDTEDIQVVDKEFAEDIKTEHLKGMAKTDDKIILLLDPYRVISFEELAKVQEINKMDSEEVN
ncbi:chemotaxis protein CheW [Natranaerofaba carboxydovora]|uniref:chemotaxis protein CheW n=1 Tax=Natranaerofaba carboxydovora TaxID=2742683 RepID=UPI001F13D503|nr:chemotaxis protein CheW [Natranaerofaba carboxydovora]UMZ75054.1 Chemotaxis protein CheW [Natranaerofaba carboxydovora]